MAKREFGQPPEDEFDIKNWRKSLNKAVHGEGDVKGNLDGDNITNITDPGTADGTLADATAKINALTAELRDTLKLFG